MTRITLDTNRYSDLQRGDRDVAEVLDAADEVVLTFVVIAELRAGFVLGRRGVENERTLEQFLSQTGVSVAFPDDQTTQHYATIHRQLRQRGTPIPDNDLWIAALAVQHQLTLYTRDSHFDYVPQLRRI